MSETESSNQPIDPASVQTDIKLPGSAAAAIAELERLVGAARAATGETERFQQAASK